MKSKTTFNWKTIGIIVLACVLNLEGAGKGRCDAAVEKPFAGRLPAGSSSNWIRPERSVFTPSGNGPALGFEPRGHRQIENFSRGIPVSKTTVTVKADGLLVAKLPLRENDVYFPSLTAGREP